MKVKFLVWIVFIFCSFSVSGLFAEGQQEKESGDKITLEVAVVVNKSREARFKEWRELVEKDFPNIIIEYVEMVVASGSESTEKLAILIAGGKAPDIVRNPMFNFAGYMVDLRPLIDRDNYDMSDFYPESLKCAQYTLDGFDPTVNFGLPANLSSDIWVYNKTMFDEAGISYPPADWDNKTWTTDVLLETAKKLTMDTDNDGKADQLGVDVSYMRKERTEYIPWSVGMNLLNEDRTEALVNDPKIVEAYQWWADLITKHKVSPTPEMQDTVLQGLAFKSGRLAMSSFGTWNIGEYQKVIKDFEWDVTMPPLQNVNSRRVTYFTPNIFCILKGTEHLDEAWEVLKIFVGTEAMKSCAVHEGRPPSRKSLAGFYSELQAGKSPSNIETVTNSFLYGRFPLMYTDQRQKQIYDIMSSELELVVLGDKTAEEALDIAKIKLDELLAAK